ncbi:tyrosine-protein phosphatase [Anaerolineales bacterium HSG6]|nr:tyrosine-protein phosphatase [Anaerolineales bacterium HSG6]
MKTTILKATVTRYSDGQLHLQWQTKPEGRVVSIYQHTSPAPFETNQAPDWSVSTSNELLILDPNPGKRVYFRLLTDDGAARTVAERVVPLAEEENFRDLGGYRTVDGRTVKWGQLYRSGDWSYLTDEDLSLIQQLGVRSVIDFRSAFEVEKNPPSRIPASVESLALPIEVAAVNAQIKNIVIGKEDIQLDPNLLVHINQLFIKEWRHQYSAMLTHLFDTSHRPSVIHCTAGKDRTGLGAAIIFWLLGVPTEVVMADYLSTNRYNQRRNERFKGFIRYHLAQGLEIPESEVDLSMMQPLIEVKPAYLQSAIDTIMADYGSLDAFIHAGLGVTKAQRQQFQAEMLEGDIVI